MGNDDYKPSNTTSSLEVKETIVEQTQQNSKVSHSAGYGDYDTKEFTGTYDENGKPIYRSVHSQSYYGGQYMVPGVYEEYWSESGPISADKLR